MSDDLQIFIPHVRVPVPHPEKENNGFDVRGVNMTDLARLMADHAPNIALLYKDFISQDFDLAEGETGETFNRVLGDMPELYVDLIELVTDGRVKAATAKSLPITVQLVSLTKIAEATFSGEESLEKFLAVAVKMFENVMATTSRLQNTPLPSTTGTSTTANQ